MVRGISIIPISLKVTMIRLDFLKTYLKKIFSDRELSLAHPALTEKFLAGRFAGKEAVLKCLGTGMIDGIALTDIEILQIRLADLLLKSKTGLMKQQSIEVLYPGTSVFLIPITFPSLL
ncbi:MAG: holo-ACP synthase [Mucilaginibacter sp.]